MALRLNLTHEILQAERARKRDPLKLSVLALVAIAACFAAYYFFQVAKMRAIYQEYAQKQAEFGAVEPKAVAAKAREEELSVTIRAGENMVQRIEGRFYWAPLLEQLVNAVPPEAQITKLTGDVVGETPKKCRLSIDGLASGTDPRKVAEDLRTTIAESFAKKYKDVTTSFRSLEDSAETVQLNGVQRPSATFAINIEFQDGDETTQPAPARTPKKK